MRIMARYLILARAGFHDVEMPIGARLLAVQVVHERKSQEIAIWAESLFPQIPPHNKAVRRIFVKVGEGDLVNGAAWVGSCFPAATPVPSDPSVFHVYVMPEPGEGR